MDGVSIDNIVMEGTECPLYVRVANRGRKYIDEAPVPPIGKMRNIQISNCLLYTSISYSGSVSRTINGIQPPITNNQEWLDMFYEAQYNDAAALILI